MEEIAISKFKARCLTILEGVRKTRRPIHVTKFGQPIAEVVPASPASSKTLWIGSLAGTVQPGSDIGSPDDDESDWEALRLANASARRRRRVRP